MGSIRAVQRGDRRMLWMAFAACAGTASVLAVAASRKLNPRVFVPVATFVVATLAAAITRLFLGGAAAPGLLAVAGAFGLSLAIGATLYTRSG
jgi:hypothetical protein